MEMSTAVRIVQEALLVSLQVPGPLIIGILVIGIVISILQAATQIHETTLVFVPKVIFTYAVLCVLGNWMLFTLVNFGRRIIESIPHIIR